VWGSLAGLSKSASTGAEQDGCVVMEFGDSNR
jgi:hypothetical protein